MFELSTIEPVTRISGLPLRFFNADMIGSTKIFYSEWRGMRYETRKHEATWPGTSMFKKVYEYFYDSAFFFLI